MGLLCWCGDFLKPLEPKLSMGFDNPNCFLCKHTMGHCLPHCGNIITHLGTCERCFVVGESGDECICGDTLISINTNNKSSAYFSPVFFDCYEHLDDLSSDVSYLNEINYFDSIDSSSVAKLTSAEQKMMNSSNSYFSAGDLDGSFLHRCSEYKGTTSGFLCSAKTLDSEISSTSHSYGNKTSECLCSAKTLDSKINGTLDSYERDTYHEFSCSDKPLVSYATPCACTHGTSGKK